MATFCVCFGEQAYSFTTIDYQPQEIAGVQEPYFISPISKSTVKSPVVFRIGVKQMMKFNPEVRPRRGFYRVEISDSKLTKIIAVKVIPLPDKAEAAFDLPTGDYRAKVSYVLDRNHEFEKKFRELGVVEFAVGKPYVTTKMKTSSKEVFASAMNESQNLRGVPVLNKGKLVGYRVESVQPNSVYERIGLKPNDVISKIDGAPLTSIGQLLFANLKPAVDGGSSIQVTRDGKSIVLNGR